MFEIWCMKLVPGVCKLRPGILFVKRNDGNRRLLHIVHLNKCSHILLTLTMLNATGCNSWKIPMDFVAFSRQYWLPNLFYLVVFSTGLCLHNKYAVFCCVLLHWTLLTSSHRMPYKPAIFFFQPLIDGRLNTHSVFLRVWPGAVSTRHTWRDIVRDDMYTRKCFSESKGTRFGGPGQKALPSMNEFTLLWIFCLIPLSTTCSFDVPSKNL